MTWPFAPRRCEHCGGNVVQVDEAQCLQCSRPVTTIDPATAARLMAEVPQGRKKRTTHGR